MTQTLTTKVLNDFITGQGYGVAPSAVEAMARELLANREAQPVAYLKKSIIDSERFDSADPEIILHPNTPEGWLSEYQAVFTVPPAPAVPDDYQHLKNVRELYHKQEDRLFSLAQRIKGASFDKYSHVPSQAVDVLEREIFGEDGDACRAAMLAAAPEGGK